MNGRDIDWVEVSKQLGGNRVPLDCMRQGLTRRTHQWTEETDKRLLDAIDVYGQHNWQLGMKILFLIGTLYLQIIFFHYIQLPELSQRMQLPNNVKRDITTPSIPLCVVVPGLKMKTRD